MYLDENECFEDIIYLEEFNDGDTIDLKLSIYNLSKLGFYYSFNDFLSKNKYKDLSRTYYIFDINYSSKLSNHELIVKYKAITYLIKAIEKISRHTYDDVNIKKSIVFREDKSIFVSFEYQQKEIQKIKEDDIAEIYSISEIFVGSDNEKKFLYINELIDFLLSKNEHSRFKYLLTHFSEFSTKCNDAYQFYLRDFSYNKLKIELDSKALEYTQKIQSVINEAQTKLIAIPTVFVLACATFDFTDGLVTIKNIATMVSLFIFAVIIQLFLNNQKSSLGFINDNIISYKETFSNNNIEKISSKFSLVETELNKQQTRLFIVEVILWSIPIILVIIWLILISVKLFSDSLIRHLL